MPATPKTPTSTLRKAKPGAGNAAAQNPHADLLGFFYPIHYRIGMELENRMCQGLLSRQQAAIIWLIESEVGADGWMRRRVIEQMLGNWFETSNSQVSQLLRELARPPLSLVVQMENPASGREKVVALTPEGKAFFRSMIDAGLEYFATTLSHVSDEEMRWGIKFLALAFGPPAVDDQGQRNSPPLKPPPGRIAD